MTSDFPFHYFSFHLEAKAPLQMPAYNKGSTARLTPKGNIIRGGFGSAFRRIVCYASCERFGEDRQESGYSAGGKYGRGKIWGGKIWGQAGFRGKGKDYNISFAVGYPR